MRAKQAEDDILSHLETTNPHEPEFRQAVGECLASVCDWYQRQDDLRRARVFERLVEPDRTIGFRVSWEADDGTIRHNRGWRVQFSHVMGPYKGGLRFSGGVTLDVLKFLGFEQTLKNALTGLPMGGAKGGADFDPKGRSPQEVARFCQSFMSELFRHIGPDVDVPAGDMGVGEAEISLLYGQYLRLSNNWHGALTGKGCGFGGSAVRKEATGYGCVYFLQEMLAHHRMSLEGRRVAVSGAGNVAIHAAEKALQLGARVVSLSDSDGTLSLEDGLSEDALRQLAQMKREGGRLRDADHGEFLKDKTPWHLECDIALPCATQNELDEEDARTLTANGICAVCEGANMPLTQAAREHLRERGVLHAPGKAANAGGVAVSGLEQSQNAIRQNWSAETVDRKLREIMASIHRDLIESDAGDGRIDYVDAANLVAFKRVARAFHAYGVF